MIEYVEEDPGCSIHGYEPIPAEYYRLCGECGHCFVTAEDLIDATNREIDAANLCPPDWSGYPEGYKVPYATDPEKITFCPECTHDF